MRNNFYHKPIASLNWEFNINNKTSISATAYGSLGRGGGGGDLGRNGSYGYFSSSRWRNPDNGYVLWDEVIKHNSGEFFCIEGKRVSNSEREVKSWDQPFIKQINYNGGIIGLVRAYISVLRY